MNIDFTNTVVINGDNYEVELYLVKEPDEKGGVIAPITFSSVKYMEITNDLANLGYYGKIAFSNFGDVLDELEILKASKKIPLIHFKLKSLSLASNSSYDDIFFTAALTQGQDIRNDEISGIVSYNFEELYVYKLKTTRLLSLDRYLNFFAPTSLTTVNEIIKSLLRFNTTIDDDNGVKIGDRVVDPIISSFIIETGTPAGETVSPTSIIDVENNTLLHDAIGQASNYLGYTPLNSSGNPVATDVLDPGIIKLENSISGNSNNIKGSRRFVMFPLLNTIKKFFYALNNGLWSNQEPDPTKKYFGNLLTEKFNVSQKIQGATYSNNTINKYELRRVDIPDVMASKWVDIYLTRTTSECDSKVIIPYQKLLFCFEQLCTAPFASNLPEKSTNTLKKYDKSEVPPGIGLAYGTNKVLKSFVFDNVLLTFRVEGQTYRKPNRFIGINILSKESSLQPSTAKERTEVDGYWYILSVNHVFIDGKYFNDYECVKIYELGREVSEGKEPGRAGQVIPESLERVKPTTKPTGEVNGTNELSPGNSNSTNELPTGPPPDEDAPGVLPLPEPETSNNIPPEPGSGYRGEGIKGFSTDPINPNEGGFNPDTISEPRPSTPPPTPQLPPLTPPIYSGDQLT